MVAQLLYIEDNSYSVYLMQFYLRRNSNYVLLIAPDGKHGWKQALSQKPDLILMDINLPDIDGWDLSYKLKRHPLTKDIPIIAVTSLTMQQNYEHSRQVGIDVHFNKASSHAELFRHVDELLNNQCGA